MTTLHNEIMNWDFKRIAKNYAILAVVAALVAGCLSVFLLWPQLSGAWSDMAQAGMPLAWRFEGLEEIMEWSLAGYSIGTVGAVSLGTRTLLLVVGLVLLALAAGYWLLVAGWLYQQAVRSDMNGVLWLLLGLVGNLAAVVLFIVYRSVTHVACDDCGGWSPKDAGYCRRCGAALGKNCPVCGEPLRRNDCYCSHCGAVTNQAEEPAF